jgi:hypothetical protein
MRNLRRQLDTLPPNPGDAIQALHRAVQELTGFCMEVQNSFDAVWHVEPAKRVEGMIRRADGTDWDPGAGAGLYQYRDAAWRLLG